MKPPVVLVVDDEEELRRSTAQVLDLAGFQVQDFPAAERALDFVTQGFNGAVVTDIRMPSMDGMSLMRRVRDIDADIPVILVTGHGDVQLAVRAMREGAYDFIEKPSIPSISPTWWRARWTGGRWCWKTVSSRPSPARKTTSRRACPAVRR